MLIVERNQEIVNWNISSDINKLIFAKTLLETCGTKNSFLMRAVANVILNRFLYEKEIDEEMNFVKCITDPYLFLCWKDYKKMDLIDLEGVNFKKCFLIANKALKGNLVDNTLSSINFHKKVEFPDWATGLVGVVSIEDFIFYNNCD